MSYIPNCKSVNGLDLSFSIKSSTDEIKQCLDLYGQTKHDGKAIGIILGEFTRMRTIELWSDGCIGPLEKEIERYYANTQRIKDTKHNGGEEIV